MMLDVTIIIQYVRKEIHELINGNVQLNRSFNIVHKYSQLRRKLMEDNIFSYKMLDWSSTLSLFG